MKKTLLLLLFLAIVGFNAYVLISPNDSGLSLAVLANQAIAGDENPPPVWYNQIHQQIIVGCQCQTNTELRVPYTYCYLIIHDITTCVIGTHQPSCTPEDHYFTANIGPYCSGY